MWWARTVTMQQAAIAPDVLKAVEASFARQTALATIGAELAAIRPGSVDIAVTRAAHILQQDGFIHGGMIALVADAAAGLATLSAALPQSSVLTIEFKINFLRPATGSAMTVTGEVVRMGRRTAVCVSRVKDNAGVDIALLQATMSVTRP